MVKKLKRRIANDKIVNMRITRIERRRIKKKDELKERFLMDINFRLNNKNK